MTLLNLSTYEANENLIAEGGVLAYTLHFLFYRDFEVQLAKWKATRITIIGLLKAERVNGCVVTKKPLELIFPVLHCVSVVIAATVCSVLGKSRCCCLLILHVHLKFGVAEVVVCVETEEASVEVKLSVVLKHRARQ